MTFEEFKKELISRVRQYEFNKLLHLVIKSKDWNELIRVIKGEPLNYISYNLNNKIITEDFLLEIPQEIRHENLMLNSDASLEFLNNKIIFLFGKATVNITHDLDDRCKVVMIGNSVLNAYLFGESMIDLYQYENSAVQIKTYQNSFLNLKAEDNSLGTITSTNLSTIKLLQNGKSNFKIKLEEESFLNSINYAVSKLEVYAPISENKKYEYGNYTDFNYTISQKDNSEININ